MLRTVVKQTLFWSILAAAMITMVQLAGGSSMLRIFTHMEDLLLLAGQYQLYCYCYPFAAAVGLTYYGIYTGIGMTRPEFWSTAFALAVFLPVCLLGSRFAGNHGLWLAYLTFYGLRSVGLFYYRAGLHYRSAAVV